MRHACLRFRVYEAKGLAPRYNYLSEAKRAAVMYRNILAALRLG